MSFGLRNLVDASTLPRREKAVAREIAWYVRDDDLRVSCSVQQLAHRSGYAEKTIRVILAGLVARGILTIIRPYRPGLARMYRFCPSAIPGVRGVGQLEMRFAQDGGPES